MFHLDFPTFFGLLGGRVVYWVFCAISICLFYVLLALAFPPLHFQGRMAWKWRISDSGGWLVELVIGRRTRVVRRSDLHYWRNELPGSVAVRHECRLQDETRGDKRDEISNWKSGSALPRIRLTAALRWSGYAVGEAGEDLINEFPFLLLGILLCLFT